jgi:hypothetical protein
MQQLMGHSVPKLGNGTGCRKSELLRSYVFRPATHTALKVSHAV